jgi:hypothetical protein
MTFENSVKACPDLAGQLKPGLQALRHVDRAYVTCNKTRNLAGSVNLDEALSDNCPQAPRWDYVVGLQRRGNPDKAIWLEVHPASSTGEVDVVLKKLAWLKEWCSDNAAALFELPGDYIWMATGSVAFPASSPQRRKLAAAGIRFKAGRFTLDTE